VDQIGQPKVEALIGNLKRYNPFVDLKGHQLKLDAMNCADIFNKCDVVAECFDNPESKASLIMGLKKGLPETPIVAASGLAGLGPIEDIKIEKRMGNVYTVGDGQTDARQGYGLFASRVGIVGSMQSHLIVQLLTKP
jgi:sulfur carrier protein ThiS adenylyltransferase